MGNRSRNRRARQQFERIWTPFEQATPICPPHMTEEEFKEFIKDSLTFKNNKYQVVVRKRQTGFGAMFELSIRRLDRKPIHDWRDLQRIKNELVGPENEAVELYPAESRLVDTANQYWLYVLAEEGKHFPFGFAERLVIGESGQGAVQRPLE